MLPAFPSLDYFGYQGSFMVPYESQDFFFFSVSVKHAIRILIETVLDLQITLNNMEILLLSLPLHEHGYFSIYLCLLQLHSSRASLLSSPFLYLISFSADSTNPPSSYLAFFEPIPCPDVRHHFLCTIVHIEEIVCLCTHPKTKSFLWTVPCQIYLGCMNVRLEKHCLEYSWFLINYFKRINDKNSALGRVL